MVRRMPEHLFRFRSIPALLDEHHELENQDIYFSPPEELNDPLEGFKDIFWRGDSIIWTNLLRHYLLCLMQATFILLAGGEVTPVLCSTLIHQTIDDLPDAHIRDTYKRICQHFLSHDASQSLIASLSGQSSPLRRDGLIFYLRFLHGLAIDALNVAFGQAGLTFLTSTTAKDEMLGSLAGRMKDMLRAHSQAASDVLGALYSIGEAATAQLNLIHDFNSGVPHDRRSWLLIAREFPECYVTALERLIYPDWHTACFVANATNASMWGAYGDGHKGVCLKFRTHEKTDGNNPTLDLYRVNSWSSDKNGIHAHYDFVPHTFNRIQYTANFPEIDFFQSLGRIPRYKLDFWYSGPNNDRSEVASMLSDEDENWRSEYWRKFSESFSIKTPEWSHEEEYRLIAYSHMEPLDTVASRKLKYRFADLAGIVFGMKTTIADKIRIIRICEQKCRANLRKDFDFYQAHYSRRTRKFELLPLSLLHLA